MGNNELLEQRARLFGEMRSFTESMSGRRWAAEDEQRWDRMNADYDRLSEQIDRGDREDRSRDNGPTVFRTGSEDDPRVTIRRNLDRNHQAGSHATEETRTIALGAWLKGQMGRDVTPEEERACKLVGLNPRGAQLEFPLYRNETRNQLAEACRGAHPDYQSRAMSAVTGPVGGYLVAPESMVKSVEVALLRFGSVMQVADVIRTSSGEPYAWPTVNQTTIKGRRVTENTTAAVDKTIPLGKETLQSWKYTSDAFLLPYELIEDSVGFNLPGLIGERLGRISEFEFTWADGASKPHGIVPGSTLGKACASQTSFTADELLDLQHSVDPAYRMNARWMMHDGVAKLVRRLKDANGQYLWQPGLQRGVPDELLGSPMSINQEMPSILTADTVAMLYGDMKKYKIRMVNGIRIYRLQERYRDNDQDGFVGFIRQDAKVIDAGGGAIRRMQTAS